MRTTNILFFTFLALTALTSCVSPPPTVSTPIPIPSSGAPTSSGGNGLPSSGGSAGPTASASDSSTSSQTGSPNGSENGSASGAENGTEDDTENSSANTNGEEGSNDLPTWESPPPSNGNAEGSIDGSPGGSGTSPSFEEADLAELEKTLEDAMGTFDGEILREQENARDKTGNVGSSGGQTQIEVLAGVGEFETFGEGNGNAPGPTTASSEGSSSEEQVFNDVPPPSPDDDIVARQIREAAMAEKDPEQRAILWEEYERYKGGS